MIKQSTNILTIKSFFYFILDMLSFATYKASELFLVNFNFFKDLRKNTRIDRCQLSKITLNKIK